MIETLSEKPKLATILPILQSLVTAEQQKLDATPPDSFKDWKDLFIYYQRNDGFQTLYQQARRCYLVPLSTKLISQVEDRMAGEVYEKLAYYFLTVQRPEGTVLLSPERTLQFYQALYPNAKIMQHLFTNSLAGISVPDGLLVKSENGVPHISSVCEYTTYRNLADIRRKSNNLQIDQRNYPKLFAESQFQLILPQNNNLTSLPGDVRPTYQEIPVSTGELGRIITFILSDYLPDSPGEPATLSDLQNRARFQSKRAVYRSGPLEPAENSYLTAMENARQRIQHLATGVLSDSNRNFRSFPNRFNHS